VAESRDLLRQNGITRIVNLAPAVVDNHFIDEPGYTYMVIDMLDGRQDDISWFLCEVIRFIEAGRHNRQKTLLHCEKGVSRSCSFAIAYLMWASGPQFLRLVSSPGIDTLSEYSWKAAMDYVISCRAACAPNTSFTCNLIEIDDLLNGESRNVPVFFRLASHRPGDAQTPVLKLIRNPETRKILLPRSSLLSSSGVYIIRPANSRCKVLYVWKGRHADTPSLKIACMMAEQMVGVLTSADTIEIIDDIAEPDSFRDHIIQEGTTRNIQPDYDDLFRGTKESVDLVSRKHVICGMLRDKPSSQATQSSQPILLVDSQDEYVYRSGTFSAHETESGEIRGEENTTQLTPETSNRRLLTATSSNSLKHTLVLKHNLHERPVMRNLSSTDIDEDEQKFSSRIDYGSRFLIGAPPLVRIGSAAAQSSSRTNQATTDSVTHDLATSTETHRSPTKSPSAKPLKPMLYQLHPIDDSDRSVDRKCWEWQRLKIYDDDDLVDVLSPLLPPSLTPPLCSRQYYFSVIQQRNTPSGSELLGKDLAVSMRMTVPHSRPSSPMRSL
jgi:hypothetical protein